MTAARRLDPSPRSALLDELADVIGETAARTLADVFAGQRLYVPAKPGPDHAITRAIGGSAAAALAENYHQTAITLPLTPAKRARVLALAAAGVRPSAIQRELRCSRSFVYEVIAGARGEGPANDVRGDTRQIDLFARD